MILSNEQQAVVDFVTDPSKGSLQLKAFAGCGKTFTIMRAVEAILAANSKAEIFLGAYNKSIAAEIKGKLEELGIDWRSCNSSTMHSAGYSAWRKIAKDVEINGDKVAGILAAVRQTMVERIESGKATPAHQRCLAEIDAFGGPAIKLVSFAKQQAFGYLAKVDDVAKWMELVDHFNLVEDLPEGTPCDRLVALAQYLYNESLSSCREVVDYDDMILAPLVFGARFWGKDWVVIDEAQDTNPARRALALKMVKRGTGRVLIVGDPSQAIYGFTGADSDAMQIMATQLKADTLLLTETRRCSKAVVAEAQRLVPGIRAHESNAAGSVTTMSSEEFFETRLSSSDVILCRNTAPIISLAYGLLSKGTACYVEGRDIGKGLIDLALRWKRIRTIAALENKLSEYRVREIDKADKRGNAARAAMIDDQVSALMVVCNLVRAETKGTGTVEDIAEKISSIFGDTQPGERPHCLTLSTIHKSKGREWKRVFILNRGLMPSRYAQLDWQLGQEANLEYVAITRAIEDLVYITIDTEQEAASTAA